jgi:hypothetical protein
MYPVILQIHQYLSWLVLLTALFALYRAFRGILLKKQWFAADRRAGLFFSVVIDFQVLAGILLYVVFSPLTRVVFKDINSVMAEPSVRFYAVEHVLVMLIALFAMHIGRSKAMKAQFAARKHRLSAAWYTLAVVLILSRIPWERIFTV